MENKPNPQHFDLIEKWRNRITMNGNGEAED